MIFIPFGRFGRAVLVGALIMSYATPAAAMTMESDERYVYLYRNFSELADSQQADAVRQTARIFKKKMAEYFPDLEFDEDAFDSMKRNQARIRDTVGEMKSYVEGIDAGRIGFRLVDLIPNGLLVTVGARLSAASYIGAAGSISLGFVVVPKHVTTIDLVTGVNSWSLVLDWTVVAIPHLGVGVGAGGGMSGRVAFGLIFGPLSRASEFTGVSASISGVVQLGGGSYLQGGALGNSALPGDFQFLYLLGGAAGGAAADATVHGNLGYVFGPAAVLRMGLAQTGVTEDHLRGTTTLMAAPPELTELEPDLD